jgi:hypothetical protein
MTNDMTDAEASYRRGYQQGAFAAMEAAEKIRGSAGGLARLREWAGTTLSKWRYHDKPDNRNVRPPAPSSN